MRETGDRWPSTTLDRLVMRVASAIAIQPPPRLPMSLKCIAAQGAWKRPGRDMHSSLNEESARKASVHKVWDDVDASHSEMEKCQKKHMGHSARDAVVFFLTTLSVHTVVSYPLHGSHTSQPWTQLSTVRQEYHWTVSVQRPGTGCQPAGGHARKRCLHTSVSFEL